MTNDDYTAIKMFIEDMPGVVQPRLFSTPIVSNMEKPDIIRLIYAINQHPCKTTSESVNENMSKKVHEKCRNPNIQAVCPHGYVLKVTNSMDTKNPGLIDGQNQMMLYLKAGTFNVPKPVKNVNGLYMSAERINGAQVDEFIENNDNERAASSRYMVRLLTFVPGKTLYEVPYTAQLFHECGEYIAKMDNVLQSFKHESISSRCFIWMLSQTPDLKKFAFAVRDEKRHSLIMEVLDAWKNQVEPCLPRLDKGIVHGDFNEQNILVNEDPATASLYHIDGVLDFGDISESCYVFEVSITIMYIMIEVTSLPANDAGGHLLAGYLKHRELTDAEWSILKECIAARFAQSLVMGAYSYEQDPGNEYLLTTAAKGWDVLEAFWRVPKQEIYTRWREIIASYSR
ncbi:unnamed protein product, partial [Meganyctiphanes norvegica]